MRRYHERLRQDKHENITDVLQCVAKGANQHRNTAPCHEYCVVPAPFDLVDVSRRANHPGRVELGQAPLEVGRHHPKEPGDRQERERFTVRGRRHVCEGAAGYALVEVLQVVDAVYC